MTSEDLTRIFLEKLRVCARSKKYCQQFTAEDEERVGQVLRLVLENPTLSEHLILEQLTGEKVE